MLNNALIAEWPASELETLKACPVCGGTASTSLHTHLADHIFFSAPGTWQMHQCTNCQSGYLNPRPGLAFIGKAYAQYYTHNAPENTAATPLSAFAKFRRGLVNNYLNRQFGYRLHPNVPLGHLHRWAFPSKALDAAEMVRHLPAPTPTNNRLLDIGCGNGIFLHLAQNRLGYQAEGIEIDPKAVAVARAAGFTIHAVPLPGSGLAPAQYNQITMSHVLEHLHNPLKALQEALHLLTPGGRIWIQVPNLHGASHSAFGANCRLLEPPRHLVMLTAASLQGLLTAAGFQKPTRLPTANKAPQMYNASWRIANRLNPASTTPALPVDISKAARQAQKAHSGSAAQAEFLTFIAYRP